MLTALFKQIFSPRPKPIPLLMLDFLFPNPLSPFRYSEFNHYLRHIPESVLLSTVPAFAKEHALFASRFPQYATRVREFAPNAPLPDCKLAYTVFLSHAMAFLPYLERQDVPLAMTLYPGGNFAFDTAASDAMLARLFAYPHLRQVLVTQASVLEYLKTKGFYTPEKVKLIYGAVIPDLYFGKVPPKRRFKIDKPALDVCFVAFKYTPLGRDKGYDIFIAAAHELARLIPEAQFHVVGNFDQNDIDGGTIRPRIRFHGVMESARFPDFYADMDLIVSPNIPQFMYPGKTDGFPTASCVEASLSGVGMICSDLSGQNTHYRDDDEVCIVAPERDAVVGQVLRYYGDPDAMAKLGINGRSRSMILFDPDVQLSSRLAILKNLIQDT